MQQRMKDFTMTKEAMDAFLWKAQVGRISTINVDGYPYTVAIHFVYRDGKIYFHGLPKGQKLNNINHCPKVCFETDEVSGLLLNNLDTPCKADTEYQSVVIIGTAGIVADPQEKLRILTDIVRKYAPQYLDAEIPNNMVKGTTVVEITIENITGKYHR
jgi:uncharacterized protein